MTGEAAPFENWHWRDGSVTTADVAVVDLDGVISDGSHRQHFLQTEPKDWDGFFQSCDQDSPLLNEIAMVNALESSLGVFVLTARPHYLLDKTMDWLGRVDVRWDALILRGKRDGRLRSPQFKQRSVRQLRKHGFNPVVAFDDDIRNVVMFREENVPTVYIHSGYYEA